MYIEYFMQSITESPGNWLFTKIITCKHYSKCHCFMFYNKQVDTLDSREYEQKPTEYCIYSKNPIFGSHKYM